MELIAVAQLLFAEIIRAIFSQATFLPSLNQELITVNQARGKAIGPGLAPLPAAFSRAADTAVGRYDVAVPQRRRHR
ncbi:hypothetical protein [Hymenobacter sp. CRA2]|uniref:hypothetical protein n=1 Tax=Hymenobacter sp. CRA2 TaxID=1955620 RepID=UPI001591C4E1|nr:hypothetical protein [Hymenobacter sp. CRA2]